ncbi:MAG: hypothetical protein JSR67_03085 [Proteobacteria bacterium]|nr:hypothetical protein [Pseudomonadota bacterium]
MLRTILTCALLFAAVVPGAAPADAPPAAQWRDLESRLQFAYYTQDAAMLRELPGFSTETTAGQPLLAYYVALRALRLAQLSAAAGGGPLPAQLSGESQARVAALAHECVQALDISLALRGDFADGLALRSACLAQPAAVGAKLPPFAAGRLRRDMARALQLAPHNPRVLLLDALNDYSLAGSLGGNRDRALGKLRRCVTAFEGERQGVEPLPGWGAAEAYLSLGRSLLEHGDALAARDALEHALLLMPQYAQARRLLKQLVGG